MAVSVQVCVYIWSPLRVLRAVLMVSSRVIALLSGRLVGAVIFAFCGACIVMCIFTLLPIYIRVLSKRAEMRACAKLCVAKNSGR